MVDLQDPMHRCRLVLLVGRCVSHVCDHKLTDYPKDIEKHKVKANSMVATCNVIEGATNLLFGLDMQ